MKLIITIVPALIASSVCWLVFTRTLMDPSRYEASISIWLLQGLIYAYIVTSSSIVHGVRLSYFIGSYLLFFGCFHAVQTVHWAIAENRSLKMTCRSASERVISDLIHLAVVMISVNIAWGLFRGDVFGWL
jgi:hypothetical protein